MKSVKNFFVMKFSFSEVGSLFKWKTYYKGNTYVNHMGKVCYYNILTS
jgi:hypothetical protein